jgi:hypothetical protein
MRVSGGAGRIAARVCGCAKFPQTAIFATCLIRALTLGWLFALSACSSSSLYFHNDAYEKLTADVKGDVAKLDVASAFTSLSTQSDNLTRDEDVAATTALVSLRNRNLARLIDPNEGDWLPIEPKPGFSANLPKARLEYFLKRDMTNLVASSTAATPTDYLEGSQKLLAHQSMIENAQKAIAPMLAVVRLAIKAHEVEKPPSVDCATAAQIAGPNNPHPTLPADVKAAFGNLNTACVNHANSVKARNDFIGKFVETDKSKQGLISLSAQSYLAAMQSKETAQLEAQSEAAKIKDLLEQMNDPKKDPEKISAELGEAIQHLDKVGALARFAGLNQIDCYLKTGLLVDLKTAQAELSGEKSDAGDVAPLDAGKDGECVTFPGGETANKAIAGVIKAIMGAVADALAADHLKRINANIIALADLKQRLSLAQATVAYENNRLLLFKAQFFTLLDQYRLLAASQEANSKLPDIAAKGFVDLRSDPDAAVRRHMALALSSYVGAWNYGRIPAQVIDFRFIQARRKYDIQLASVTAANYKSLIEPIAEALAAYGEGGITPDTLAEVLSNLGILSGIILD